MVSQRPAIDACLEGSLGIGELFSLKFADSRTPLRRAHAPDGDHHRAAERAKVPAPPRRAYATVAAATLSSAVSLILARVILSPLFLVRARLLLTSAEDRFQDKSVRRQP